jgi:hypothetical protein
MHSRWRRWTLHVIAHLRRRALIWDAKVQSSNHPIISLR